VLDKLDKCIAGNFDLGEYPYDLIDGGWIIVGG
jgi:hypothetical protein